MGAIQVQSTTLTTHIRSRVEMWRFKTITMCVVDKLLLDLDIGYALLGLFPKYVLLVHAERAARGSNTGEFVFYTGAHAIRI